MPVLVVCPSCATQLNIKDEHVSRAVKCPKCGYVIPPAQAATPAIAGPPPLPAPSTPPSPNDAPAPVRPTAKPADRSRDDDDAARRPGAKPRGRDRDDDDRPAKRPRRTRDDDDDYPRNPPKTKSGAPMVLLILGGLFLVCCGGAGAIGYYFYKKGKEFVQVVESINLRVNRGSYDRLTEGMLPGEVENVLGAGTIATPEQVLDAFPENNRARAGEWSDLAANGRVVLWRNGDEFLLAGFYPSATNGRLQMKTYQPKGGFNAAEQRFATDAEAAKPGWGIKKESLPAIAITAVDLAKAYKADAAAADAKFKGKLLAVEGKVKDITMRLDDVVVLLDGIVPDADKPNGATVFCVLTMANAKDVWRLSRGQKIKLRGKGEGEFGKFLNVVECKLESQEADPSLQVQVSPFLNEFTNNAEAADAKYKDKQLTLLSAVVEMKEGAGLVLGGSLNKKGQTIKIRAALPDDLRKQLENVKVGGRVTIKGEYSSFSDGTIYLNRCWLVP